MIEAELYRLLGLSSGATLAEVKSAFRRLALQHHPDRGGRSDRFSRISEAYQALLGLSGGQGAPPEAGGSQSRKQSRGSGGRVSLRVVEAGRELLGAVESGARVAAAKKLSRLGRKSAYPFLREALADPEKRVAAAAVRAIGALNIRQSAPELGALFLRADPELKLTVLESVRRMGALRAFNGVLLAALKDSDRRVRARAAELLRRRES